MTMQETICAAVDSDKLEEGLSRLRSAYAILSDADTNIIGNEWLCDKLYGVEILMREAVEMLSDCRVDAPVFDVTALSVTLTGKPRKGARV